MWSHSATCRIEHRTWSRREDACSCSICVIQKQAYRRTICQLLWSWVRIMLDINKFPCQRGTMLQDWTIMYRNRARIGPMPLHAITWTNKENINTLAPGKFEWNFKHVIFKQILVIDAWCISCEIALIWMSLDFTDDQSTLVQVMAWCRQATSHYLSQCWPRSLLPYGVTRPQWVNTMRPRQNGHHFADTIFKWIFLNENVCILLWISLKFVPKVWINNISALV